MASVIIPVYNNLESRGEHIGFRDCLRSTIETCNDDIEIIIIDNGSTDPVSSFVLEQQDNRIVYVRYPNALGYPGAVNKGIVLSSSDLLILVNSDVKWLGPGWLQRLVEPFHNNPRMGITGCLSNIHAGLNEEFLIFFCVAVRKQLIDEVGYLDESFAPGAGEDIDLCIRAKDYRWGVQNIVEQKWSPEGGFFVSDFPVYHRGEATVHTLDGWEESFARNMDRVTEKHFHRKIPGWFDYANIYDRMLREFDTGAHFVEVGSWFGRSTCYMARRIKDSGKGIVFDAVDTWDHPGQDQNHFDIIRDRGGSMFTAFQSFMKQGGVTGHVNPIRSDSVLATDLYDDRSLDFVWLDADHSYEGIMKDLYAWYPKVKFGGYIGGHDYMEHGEHMPVSVAVNHFFRFERPSCFIPPGSWLVRK